MHLFETGVTGTSHGVYVKGFQESLKASCGHTQESRIGALASGGSGCPLLWEHNGSAGRDVPYKVPGGPPS